jgi:hypothetical protein
LRTSFRLRGAGFRTYCAGPEKVNSNFSRHWKGHQLIAYSPSGIRPFPFMVWLGWPSGINITCYHERMVRGLLLDRLKPDSNFINKLRSDGFDVYEYCSALVEYFLLKHWLASIVDYCEWYYSVAQNPSTPLDVLLDPPASCLRPNRKNKANREIEFQKFGLIFRYYDLVRTQSAPLAIRLATKGYPLRYIQSWSGSIH